MDMANARILIVYLCRNKLYRSRLNLHFHSETWQHKTESTRVLERVSHSFEPISKIQPQEPVVIYFIFMKKRRY